MLNRSSNSKVKVNILAFYSWCYEEKYFLALNYWVCIHYEFFINTFTMLKNFLPIPNSHRHATMNRCFLCISWDDRVPYSFLVSKYSIDWFCWTALHLWSRLSPTWSWWNSFYMFLDLISLCFVDYFISSIQWQWSIFLFI